MTATNAPNSNPTNDALTRTVQFPLHSGTRSPKRNIGTSSVPLITLRHLIPSLMVLTCSIVGPLIDHPRCPVGTDGAQFRCWLQQQEPASHHWPLGGP